MPIYSQPYKTVEESLEELEKITSNGYVTVEDCIRTLSGKGRALLLLCLSFPFCLPIQLPGLSIVFGLCIAFLGLRTAFGKHIWLPKKILKAKLRTTFLKKIIKKSSFLFQKARRWIHPRWPFFVHTSPMPLFHGLLLFLLGLLLALPLPIPFSNLIVAWPTLLLSLGLLEDDGLFVLVSYVFCLCFFLFFSQMIASFYPL